MLDADKEFDQLLARRKMLACQVGKKRFDATCDSCAARFECYTVKAKELSVYVNYSGWRKYQVFATSEGEARELVMYWPDSDICPEADSGEGDYDIDVEEEHQKNG